MTEERLIGGLPERFWKMSGAGNDFLVFDGRVEVGAGEEKAIETLCRRGTGVGADGVLFVYAESGTTWRADYHNADGGRARFCANGTRCAARFAHRFQGAPERLTMMTGWGPVGATVHADGRVTLALPEDVTPAEELETFGGDGVLSPTGTSVSVGVPHLVVALVPGADLQALDVAALGAPLRRHPRMPEGANVSFVSRLGDGFSIRTFERGVEGETLACGSGVVATAVVLGLAGERPPVALLTRSGATLTVDFTLDGRVARNVTLTGDARLVYTGVLTEEAL